MEANDTSKGDKDPLADIGEFAEEEMMAANNAHPHTPHKRAAGVLAEDLHGDSAKKHSSNKKTVEQMSKRYKYDLLHSFFRIYLVEDKDSSVEKEAISLLYQKKMPADHQMARNALFRRLWTYYGDRIKVYQCNYRELIKGLRIRFSEQGLEYDGMLKDLEELRSAGISDFWTLKEEDLLFLPIEPKKSGSKQQTPSQTPQPSQPQSQQPAGSSAENKRTLMALGVQLPASGSDITTQLDQVENAAKLILGVVTELRIKIAKLEEEKSSDA